MVKDRLMPCEEECEWCGEYQIVKHIDAVSFKIKGHSAANGYSTHVGDIEKKTGKEYNHVRDWEGEAVEEDE